MDKQKTLDVGVSYKSVVNDGKSNRKPFLDVEQQGIFRGHLLGHLYLFDLSFYKWGNWDEMTYLPKVPGFSDSYFGVLPTMSH